MINFHRCELVHPQFLHFLHETVSLLTSSCFSYLHPPDPKLYMIFKKWCNYHTNQFQRYTTDVQRLTQLTSMKNEFVSCQESSGIVTVHDSTKRSLSSRHSSTAEPKFLPPEVVKSGGEWISSIDMENQML